MQISVFVDVTRTVLSGKSKIFKTERFVKETRTLGGIDNFLAKVAEGFICAKNPEFFFGKAGRVKSFVATTTDGAHKLFFKVGAQIKTNGMIADEDFVFFGYEGEAAARKDARFTEFIRKHPTFSVVVCDGDFNTDDNEFNKVYSVLGAGGVNFPLLSEDQLKIVTNEEGNMLVQGVAGSGKTNVCIDKIIYCACREYGGRVLYTTYSRGLIIDTKNKVTAFRDAVSRLISEFRDGKTEFGDDDYKKAVENKLGIWLSEETPERITDKLTRIVAFLDNNVDYCLLEDIYKQVTGKKANIADEGYFVSEYAENIKNYSLAGNLEKIKQLSLEVVFKEIFGLIYGSADGNPCLSFEQYRDSRKESFTVSEIETIYAVAADYGRYLEKNGKTDNNFICREMMQLKNLPVYSLAVIDEVQDFTEINLVFLKVISVKMFCVGDGLQMINPSFFSFASLKRIMFKKDVTAVTQLVNNYRNTKRIEEVVEALNDVNVKTFGVHSFVLKGKSVEADIPTQTVFVKGDDFAARVAKENFDNLTFIVSNAKKKEEVKKILPRQEVLTVSEIKGLERNAVVLTDILSDNADKWDTLKRRQVNRKTADENSVYRYYFNLFYVGATRARQYLYVAESNPPSQFEDFFRKEFETLSSAEAVDRLSEISTRLAVDDIEMKERVNQFLGLGQYDNARFAAKKIADGYERDEQTRRVDVYEKFVKTGNYTQAGLELWKIGLTEDARRQFVAANRSGLIELLDEGVKTGKEKFDIDILSVLPLVTADEGVREAIDGLLNDDLAQLNKNENDIEKLFKKREAKNNG